MRSKRRLQMVYPGFAFRAGINYKNIEVGKPWAEGNLFCDDELNYYIIEKKEESDGYRMHSIFPGQIWTDTYFRSGNGHDIFESDIIKLTAFSIPEDNGENAANEKKDEPSEDNNNGTDNNTADECSHPIYISPPSNSSTLWTISGVVCFYGGTPCIYYYSDENENYALAPLGGFFEPTGFPPENMAAEIMGNIIDNPDIINKIFKVNTGI